jgi:predicted ATP-grasp superfamily ATP-dependent carboligase
MDVLGSPSPSAGPPPFADIPHPGMRIKDGRPVLTFFARADTPDACLDGLRRTAADLDRLLLDGPRP